MKTKDCAVKTENRFYGNYEKISAALSGFASKKITLPLFIILAFLGSTLTVYLSGYKYFGLDVHIATYQFFLCDYSVGFCSRLLVGAIITHFTDTVSGELIRTVINTAVMFTLAAQSCAAGTVIRTALKRKNIPVTLLTLVFVFSPLGLTENMVMPGTLDVYILALFLIWLAFYPTPVIYFITPPVCLAAMAIHYEFLFTCLPPMLVLLMYKGAFADKKTTAAAAWTSFGVSSAVSAGSFFWFVFLAKDHLKMTADDYYYRMLARLDIDPAVRSANMYQLRGTPIYKDYFDYYIFGKYEGRDHYENTGDFFSFLKNYTVHNTDWKQFEQQLKLFIPVLAVFCLIWFLCMRRTKGIQRFVFFCCAAQSLVLVPELIISTDTWRWVSGAFIAQFAVFFAVYYDRRSVLNGSLIKKKRRQAAAGLCEEEAQCRE